jgi:hypothetical protein
MDLLHLVDRLEELVGSAQKMPIGSRAIVDRRRILDIVDQMRVAVPQEVRDAQEMVSHRDEVFREAEEEARLIIARAEERAERMVEQHELTIAARQRAEEVARDAEARIQERIAEANEEMQQRLQDSSKVADQQMEAADDYARELLVRLEGQLQAFVRSVQSGIAQLETAPRPAAARTTPGSYGVSEPSSSGQAAAADDDSVWTQRDVDHEAEAARDEELQDLLHTQGDADAPPVPEPGVIDDYALPQLDDEPAAVMREQFEARDTAVEGRDADGGYAPRS